MPIENRAFRAVVGEVPGYVGDCRAEALRAVILSRAGEPGTAPLTQPAGAMAGGGPGPRANRWRPRAGVLQPEPAA
jgi:hypothetical protein